MESFCILYSRIEFFEKEKYQAYDLDKNVCLIKIPSQNKVAKRKFV